MLRYFRKLCASALKRYYIAVNNGYSVGTSYGVYFLFDWRHSIDKKVAMRLYENDQLVYTQRVIVKNKPDYFFDIGAHSGLYSILAKHNLSEMEVHAFEPDLQNLSQLYANLYLNRMYDSIIVHKMAISNISGTSFLERSDGTSRATRHLSNTGIHEIQVSKFDELMSGKSKRAFFKIDVEGFECEVIEGAENFLKLNECILLIESFPPNYEKLLKKMIDLGYKEMDFPGNKDDHIFVNFEFIS